MDYAMCVQFIQAFLTHGHWQHAQSVFKILRNDRIPQLYTTIITFCGRLGSLEAAKLAHSELLASKMEINPILASALITMYTGCNNLFEAEEVFKQSIRKYWVESWNAMITSYGKLGEASKALKLFHHLQHKYPSVLGHRTYNSVLIACLKEFNFDAATQVCSRVSLPCNH